ncbi:MAG: YkgJ family cysteine cluster protein [Candidatus Altiarchaeota archaeon]
MTSITPCQECTLCCKHITIEIDAPVQEKDYDEIRWFIMHDNIIVFIDHEDCWYLEVRTKCSALTEDGLCSIYDNRPVICREYDVGECERHNEYYKTIFRNIEDFNNYMMFKRALPL